MAKKVNKKQKNEGSIELIVLALLAALIVVLAIPLLSSIGTNTQTGLSELSAATSQ